MIVEKTKWIYSDTVIYLEHRFLIPNISFSHLRGLSQRFVLVIADKCDPQSRGLTQLPLNQLLITLVHRVGCTLEIMWPRNIQNDFEIFCTSLGFEPDIFCVVFKTLKHFKLVINFVLSLPKIELEQTEQLRQNLI